MKTDITLSIALEDVEKLSATIKALECRLEAAEGALARERKGFDDYRSAESERLANERKLRDAVFAERVSVLSKNERKHEAMEEFYRVKAACVNRIYEIVEKRLTKTERQKMNAERRKMDEAWEKFDKVQKECAK